MINSYLTKPIEKGDADPIKLTGIKMRSVVIKKFNDHDLKAIIKAKQVQLSFEKAKELKQYFDQEHILKLIENTNTKAKAK